MKKIFFNCAALLMGATLVTSCSDDKNDPDVQGPKLEETTFTESFGLDLKVGDAPMYGKVVTFSPAADMKTAELTMQSTFDFASIPDFPQGLVNDTKVQCPGVLPGTPVEVLKVNLVPDNTDDKYYTFSGEADATYCTYKYSGKVSERNLKLSITDVKLKNQSLANTSWVPATRPDDFDPETVYADGIHIVWSPSGDDAPTLDLMGFKMTMETILRLAIALPVINDESSANDMLALALQSVTFKEDGNVVASYLDTEEGKYLESPVNMVQYVIKEDGKMLLYLNPQAIAMADTKAVDLNALVQQVWNMTTPMLAQGVPLTYNVEGNDMQLYLGKDVTLPLIQQILIPVLEDESLRAMLLQLIESSGNEELAGMKDMIEGVLTSLPGVLRPTTDVQIGLNLTKK